MVLAQATKPRAAAETAGRARGQTLVGRTRSACAAEGTSSPLVIKAAKAAKTGSGSRFIEARARMAARRISRSSSAVKCQAFAVSGGVKGFFKSGSTRGKGLARKSESLRNAMPLSMSAKAPGDREASFQMLSKELS